MTEPTPNSPDILSARTISMSIRETSAKDEAEIKAGIATFAEAWNAKDAKHLVTVFAEDSDFVDVLGRWFKGRTEIEQAHAQGFATFLSGKPVAITGTQIKFLTPDVAVMHNTWETTGDKKPTEEHQIPDTGVFTVVTTRKEDTWQITAFHNTGTVPMSD